MNFRPCIDIHNGKVKQIVGGTYSDNDSEIQSNYVSERNAEYYANLYKEHNLKGGHIAILNTVNSPSYEASKKEAFRALKAYPGGLQIGGGITSSTAAEFIEAGASHVIITSYIFEDGQLSIDRLSKLRKAVGKNHIVLDLSCRRRDDQYYVVTDHWQTFTDTVLAPNLFVMLSLYCDEFLIHAVDVEGTKAGIDETVVRLLGEQPFKITYAGGISSLEDINTIKTLGNNRLNFTVGSSLSLFGGKLDFEEVIACTQ